MTTHASPHEEFEIAALRRARGALEADASDRLEAHVRTCTACRDFAATAHATEAALHLRVRTAAASRDWEAVRSAFRTRRRKTRRGAATASALVAPLLAVFWWALPALLFWCVATWLVVMLAIARRGSAADARRARRVEAVDDELLAFYRADLDREIAVIGGSRPMIPVLTVCFGVMIAATLALLAKGLLFDGGRLEARLLMPLIVLPLVYAWLWHRARMLLPRLERERAELS